MWGMKEEHRPRRTGAGSSYLRYLVQLHQKRRNLLEGPQGTGEE